MGFAICIFLDNLLLSHFDTINFVLVNNKNILSLYCHYNG